MLQFFRILRALGCEGLCNFGIGSPRQWPPFLAIVRYVTAFLNPWGHGYAEKQGRMKTRIALAKNCLRTLEVAVSPEQILLLEGSKPGLRYVLQGLGLIGKVVLPMPFYPGNLDGVLAAGCEPFHIAMSSVQGFIQNLENALVNGLRPVAVVLSFDNPQWLKRNQDDYARLVALARQYAFILISDEAYRDLSYGGWSCSVMQVEGWEDVAVCIQTASKPFCMAGHKLGAVIARQDWVLGTNKPLLLGILAIKGRDSEGGSPAAQKAYATALRCDWYPKRLAQKYYRRALLTVRLLRTIPGIVDIEVPAGGMFVYFRIEGLDSMKFYLELFELGFLISPGERFGEPDRIRWCLNQPNWVTRRGVAAVAQAMKIHTHRRLHTASDVLCA